MRSVPVLLGFLSASLVKTPYKPPVKREPISLDRFILLKGMPAGLSLLLLSIPYGMTTNYVAMYAREIGIHTNRFLFTFMAVGMAISRIFSGKLVGPGKDNASNCRRTISGYIKFLPARLRLYLIQWNDAACTILFFGIALLMGNRIRNYVSGIQYSVRKPCPPTTNGEQLLPPPDLMGCRNWYRYADRRIYSRNLFV